MKERKDEHENHLHIYSKPNIRLNEGMMAVSVRDIEKMVVHEKPIIVYVFAYSFIFGSVGSVLLGLFFML